jgi:hypothetical protein
MTDRVIFFVLFLLDLSLNYYALHFLLKNPQSIFSPQSERQVSHPYNLISLNLHRGLIVTSTRNVMKRTNVLSVMV